MYVDEVLKKVNARDPDQPEFLQAVDEVFVSLADFIEENPQYQKANILERVAEPDRTFIFRVPWETDDGEVMVDRGIRVQFNNAIGPYKGGIRFHPSVDLSIVKFLGFEQIFKNALTTLPMGGAKGGSDFDPKGKSNAEVMRFCQSFMAELYKYIGPDVDVPAGDIGVGAREIGYMFGAYKRIRNEFTGVLTGKNRDWGGSHIRPEATGYGAVYFADEMLKTRGDSLDGKVCLISGSGNVAQYTAEKLIQLGAEPVTLSDSSGFIYDAEGVDEDKLAFVMELKNVRRGRIEEYAREFSSAKYTATDPTLDHNPMWAVEAACAFPSATQNEINGKDAEHMVKNGVFVISEGANMPTTPEGVEVFLEAKILYGPGKAANAGGVSVSGLEMSQNSLRLFWTRQEVDERLRGIMAAIHEQCMMYGYDEKSNYTNYVKGANVAGFKKVADAMLDQGLV
ncbi:MAG: NADP-specific glutamate dehydrogenase [candidate division Zixibacteria bacterium]|nr:NADP-specific glutamate dehydrogenase [candidate division Zixibacteria bacterium]